MHTLWPALGSFAASLGSGELSPDSTARSVREGRGAFILPFVQRTEEGNHCLRSGFYAPHSGTRADPAPLPV